NKFKRTDPRFYTDVVSSHRIGHGILSGVAKFACRAARCIERRRSLDEWKFASTTIAQNLGRRPSGAFRYLARGRFVTDRDIRSTHPSKHWLSCRSSLDRLGGFAAAAICRLGES